MNLKQLADGSLGIENPLDGALDARFGGPSTPTVASPRFISVRKAKVPLGVADTGGGVLSWVNPELTAIIIERLTVRVTTKSTGASTVDFGTTTSTATTSSDTLIDGVDLGTAVGTFDNIKNGGTNGKSCQELAVGGWITGSKASGACAGLVGYAYIEYYPV